MKQLTKMIGSLTAKFAALLLTFGLVGSSWGADPVTIQDANGSDISVYEVSSGFYKSAENYLTTTDFYITSKAGLKFFRDMVSACDGGTAITTYATGAGQSVPSIYTNNLFKDKTVHLLCDVDLENEDWIPIGYPNWGYNSGKSKTQFYGSFNGHGHKVSNLKVISNQYNQNQGPDDSSKYWKNYGAYGFFGALGSAGNQVFENFTIENVTAVLGTLPPETQGGTYIGAIVGNLGSNATTFRNCHVTGTINLSCQNGDFVGGLFGIGTAAISSCSVEGAAGSIIKGATAGGLAGTSTRTQKENANTITDNIVSGVTVKSEATNGRAGGLVGMASNPVSVTGNTVHDVTLSAENGVAAPLVCVGTMTVEENNITTPNVTVISAPVAKIYDENGTFKQGYQSLPAAVDAVLPNETIKLNANIKLGSALPVSKKFTIDLNGKAIDNPNASSPFAIAADGDLTVTDTVGGGTVTHQTTSYMLNVSQGILRIAGGIIGGTSGSALYCSGTGKLFVTGGEVAGKNYGIQVAGGTVEISGGSVHPVNAGQIAVSVSSGTLTINGNASISVEGSGNGLVVNGGTVNVAGGNVSGFRAINMRGNKSSETAVTVSGGTVNGTNVGVDAFGATGGTITISGGTVTSANGDGVVSGAATVLVTDNASISAAKRAVAATAGGTNVKIAGGTVATTAMAADASALEVAANAKAEVSGGTLVSLASKVVYVATDGELKVTGGTFNVNGTSDCAALVRGGGRLTMEGGTVHLSDASKAIFKAAANTSDSSILPAISVSGGYFTRELTSYLEDGYICVDNDPATPEPWKVVISSSTVTFQKDDGTAVATGSVEYGKTYDTVAALKTAVDAYVADTGNRIFKGWFVVDGGTMTETEYKLTDVITVTPDFTVRAKWVDAVAKYNDTNYETFQEAMDAAEADNPENIEIDLLGDATLDITAWNGAENALSIGTANTQSITINGNNHKLTFNQKNSDWNNVATMNDAQTKLILNNMSISNSGYNGGPWNRHDINFNCAVELNNVTSDKALAFKNAATLNNVTVADTGDIYGIWIRPTGQPVAIEGLTLTCGRGIKIDDQYAGETAADTTLTIKDATFNTTGTKSAILVKSSTKTTINASGTIDISNVAADKTNLVWVDEDAASSYSDVTVTGATVIPEKGAPSYDAAISSDGTNIKGYYSKLADALAAATVGDTVTLLRDIDIKDTTTDQNAGIIAIDKSITIDGGNHTIKAIDDGKGKGHVFTLTVKDQNTGAYAAGDLNITIKNLVVDGNNVAKHGINIYGEAEHAINVTLQNVETKNNRCFGVNVNSAVVVAENLKASGNGWGKSVGIDPKYQNASLTISGENTNLADEYAVDMDNSSEANTSMVSISEGSYTKLLQSKTTGNTFAVSGGSFGEVLPLEYCAANYIPSAADPVTGKYTVVLGTVITYATTHGTAPEKKAVAFDANNQYTLTAADLPDFTVAGYSFKGWDKAVGDVITGPVTITALWNSVAQIGETKFESLQAAIDAAHEMTGDTVKLLADLSYELTSANKIGVTIDKSITLDGDGHTITFTGTVPPVNTWNYGTDCYGIDVNSTTEITTTIKNLKIVATGEERVERALRFNDAAGGMVDNVTITTGACGIHVKGTGNVAIKNSTITTTPSNDNHCIAHLRSAVLLGSSAMVTLTDNRIIAQTQNLGSLDMKYWAKGVYVGTGAKGTMILESGNTVTADIALVIDGSTDATKFNKLVVKTGNTVFGAWGSASGESYKLLEIAGGDYYDLTFPTTSNIGNMAHAKISITDGTFPIDVTAYCAEGYACNLDSGTGRYVVGQAVASITSDGATTYYTTFANAVAAAAGTKAITLLADVGDYVLANGDTLIVNANGKTINVKAVEGSMVEPSANGDIITYTAGVAVAKIGETTYTTLQKAVDAAYGMTGDVTITLISDVSGSATIKQNKNLNLTVDGANHEIVGQLLLDGGGSYGNDTLTIENVNFKYDAANIASGMDGFIYVLTRGTLGRLSDTHNVTVRNCKFDGEGSNNGIVAVKAASNTQNKNFVLSNLEAKNVHSLAQLTAVVGVTVENCVATQNVNSGINLSGDCGQATITGNEIVAQNGYALRAKGASSSGETVTSVTVSGNNMKATPKDEDDGVIVVTSGTMEIESGKYEGVIYKTAGELEISGGSYKDASAGSEAAEIDEVSQFIDPEQFAAVIEDGWVVLKDSKAVVIHTENDVTSTTGYVSFSEASKKLVAGDVVKLLAATDAGYVLGAEGALSELKVMLNGFGEGFEVTATTGNFVVTSGPADGVTTYSLDGAAAKIGETYYRTVKDAFDAAQSASDETITIMILKNVTTSDWTSNTNFRFNKNILLDTEVEGGVSVNLEKLNLLTAGKILTISDDVAISKVGQFGTYDGNTVTVNAFVNATQFYIYKGTFNLAPTATATFYYDGQIGMWGDVTFNVEGQLAAGDALALDVNTATRQVQGGYVKYFWGNHAVNLKNTYMDTTWVVGDDRYSNYQFGLTLDNSVLRTGKLDLLGQSASTINLTASRIIATGDVGIKIYDNDVLNMSNDSSVTTKAWTNNGKVVVDMTGVTDDKLPLTVVTVTGADAPVAGAFEFVGGSYAAVVNKTAKTIDIIKVDATAGFSTTQEVLQGIYEASNYTATQVTLGLVYNPNAEQDPAATYMVKPTAVSNGNPAQTVDIANDDLVLPEGGKIAVTLRVPTTIAVNGDVVKVTHTFTDGTESFNPTVAEQKVTVEVTHFSTFTIEAVVAKIERANEEPQYFTSLEAANNESQSGDTVQIIKAGDYTLPNLPNNITIEGKVEGVVFNHTTAGSVASIPNGATFKNVTFNFGTVNYHGFQKAGTITMEGCTLNGMLFSYGDMTFTNCSFNQSNSDYHMWAYAGNLTYTDCTFVNEKTGKFLNVYNEGLTKYTVKVDNCTFVNSASDANKAALNVKDTSKSNKLKYDVFISNSKTEGAFPAASTSENSDGTKLVVYSALLQVDDIATGDSYINVAEAPGSITFNEDGKITGGTFVVVDDPLIAAGYVKVPNAQDDKLVDVVPGAVITYVVAHGEAPAQKAVPFTDGKYTLTEADLPTLTVPGYVFTGWDKSAGNEITGPTTITALWKAVAKIGETTYDSLQDALNDAATASADVTVEILEDIDLTGATWTPVYLNGYDGSAKNIVVNGNNKTITGLTAPLIREIWSSASIKFKDLTVSTSTIGAATISVGSGSAAFIGGIDSGSGAEFTNCHVVNCTIGTATYCGAFIGYTSDRNAIALTNCSVERCTITGTGSSGSLIGHTTSTKVTITDTTVTENTITGANAAKTGILIGTDQGTTSLVATESGNTLYGGETQLTGSDVHEVGRVVGGNVTVTEGGSYSVNPTQTSTGTVSTPEDYEVTQKDDGFYTVTAMPAVAKIGDTTYTSLQKALNAAHEMTGDVTVELVADITEVAMIHQKAGLNLTLDGAEKTITGQIYIDGDGRYNDADVLTIQNVKFAYNASTYDDGFIVVPSTKTEGKPYTTGKYNYAHNVTVSNCEFAGSGETTVAFRVASGAGANGVELDSLKVTGGHSFAQLTGVKDLTITGCTITGTKNGINIIGGEGTGTISGTTLTTIGGYTVRLKEASKMSVTLVDNTFNGAEGIISSATGGGKITVNSGSYVGALDSSAGKLVITGGRFSAEIPEAYCGKDADGNQLYPIAGLYPDTPATPNGVGLDTVAVAIVTQGDPATTTRYVSLAAAVAAANTGDTVKLLVDTTIKSITVDKKIILDLNAKTVSSDGVDLFYVTSNGDLTIVGNGKVNGPTNGQNFDGKALISVDGGKLTIENGTFTATGSGSDGMYGVYVYNSGTATFGKADGTGPTITSHFAAIGTNNTTAPVHITVNGGTYTANAAPTNNEWWSYFCAPVYAAAAGDFTLNGGTFNGYYGFSSRYANVDQDVMIDGDVVFFASSLTQVFVDDKTGSAGISAREILAKGNTRTIPEGWAWVETATAGIYKLTKLYTVTFYDFNGTTVLGTKELPDGATAAQVQAKANEIQITPFEGYTFVGWTPEFAAINGKDQEYTATYKIGAFYYPVGEGGVKIDPKWINTVVKSTVTVDDTLMPGSADYKKVIADLTAQAPNGIPWWQNYVLGLTGAEGEKLTIWGAAPETVEKTGAPTGNYVIFGELKAPDGWKASHVKIGTKNAKSGYTVNANYRLAARNADGTFSVLENATSVPVVTTVVDENEEDEEGNPIIRKVANSAPELLVPMGSAANKSLAVVIQITVDSTTTNP